MKQYSLPNKSQSLDRVAELTLARAYYGYDTKSVGFPVSTKPGPRDIDGVNWFRQILDMALRIRENFKDYLKISKYDYSIKFPITVADPNLLNWVGKVVSGKSQTLLDVGNDFGEFFLPDFGMATPIRGQNRTIDDYIDMFQTLELPKISEHFETDESFAYGFVAGPNPNMIRKMTSKTGKFPISNKELRTVPEFAFDDLDAAIAEGRIFWVDYEATKDLKSGVSYNKVPKYMYSPIIAFAVTKEGERLYPFAIQCGQSPDGRPIFTPQDGNAWKIAKNCVLAAHNTYHEVLTHLGFTHLLMEAIDIATRRQLPYSHPVYALLSHHFEGTILINYAAVHGLILDTRAVDRLIGSEIPNAKEAANGERLSTYELLKKERLAYSFRDNYLPSRLSSHGTDTNSRLKIYPYRDDGLLVWQEIETWANNFVSYYYKNDQVLQADYEIQNWAHEIVAIGQVKDFPDQIKTRQQLAEVLTMIMFTSSAQHAAVNFPQSTDMAFVPANPIAGYGPEPEAGKEYSRQDWINHLPPMEVAVVTVSMLNLLASIHHTKLGAYDDPNPEIHRICDFDKGEINGILKNFKGKLVEVESTIDERNKDSKRRLRPYIHLKPSRIPQSINI